MGKPDYTRFDEALLAQIEGGRNTLMALDSKASGLLDLTQPFRKQDHCGNSTPEYRIIDRRLQALRKKGLLRWSGKVWERIGTF